MALPTPEELRKQKENQRVGLPSPNTIVPSLVKQREEGERLVNQARSAPDLFNPMQMQSNIRETFSAPRTTPSAPQSTALPAPGQLLRTQYEQFKPEPQPSRLEWARQRVDEDSAKAAGNPVFRAIDTALKPISSVVALAQTLPGVSAFQREAGEALGVPTQTAPFKGPAIIDAPAGFIGQIAGSAAGMQGAGIRPVADPLASGRGAAQAIGQRAPRLSGNLAQRGIEGAVGGAIAGAIEPALRGQTDLRDVGTGALLGAGAGALGDVAMGLPGFAKEAAQGIVERGVRGAASVETAAASVPTGRLRVQNNTERLSKLMGEIKPVVTERMTPPLENQRELAKWLKPHLGDTSLNEINRLSYDDMVDLASEVQKGMKVPEMARQVARERGQDLDSLLDGTAPTFRQQLERQRMGQVAGAIEPPTGSARVALNTDPPRQPAKSPETPKTSAEPPVVQRAREQAESTPSETPLTRPLVDDETLVSGNTKTQTARKFEEQTDELEFARTVRTSGQTPPMLRSLLEDNRLTGSRTSDQANAASAQRMIERDGAEKVADRLIGKKGTLNAVENTAAQVLARYYSETGQLERAVSIISKTAKSGRELGQAVQALSRWNKLDQEGALLLAERQLNRRTKDTDAWKSLTPEQARPVQQAAQGIERVQNVQNLAKEVVDMLSTRAKNQPFSEAEQSLIRRFNQEINDFDNKVRPILRQEKQAREGRIREIQKTKPADRTRDQVVNLLNAQADKAREALKRQRNMGIVSDQTNPVILYSIIGASHIAEGAVKYADWAEMMIRSGITDRLSETYVRSVNRFRKENGLPTNQELNRVINAAIKEKSLDQEMANSFRAMAAEIGFYADDVKLELTKDLQSALRSIGKSTLGEKVSALQTSSMLLNVPTFLRNAIGNYTMILAEKMNKVAAVPIDWTVSKLTGERTIRFNSGSQEKFWKNYAIGTKAGWDGLSPTGTLDSYDLKPNTFGDKNPLKYITQTLGASLQGFDFAAYQKAYGEVVSTYATNIGKAQGLTNRQIKEQLPDLIKQLDDKIIEMADQAGLYATFQDETLLSKGAVSVKQGLNAITDVPIRKLRERGIVPESLSTEGFGLGDIVLKFAKTPANLVMRGIDYSPLGLVRSVIELLPAVMNKGFNQREFVLSLSRATTGTLGFTGLGFVLAQNGILTGASSQDKDLRSIQEQAGQGAYKANLSALKRWVLSGFDPNEAQTVEGDVMIDYAWAQPVAISLGMGVNAAEALNKPLKPGEERSNFKLASDSILGGIQTILENPLVTGLQNITDAADRLIKQQDFSGFTHMIQGVPTSFIPTIVGQVRTGMDNTQRESFDKRFFNAVWNQIKNKVPGASETLPVSYDSLGNPRERIQGGESGSLANYLTALLSPVKYTEYKVTPEAKLALDLLKESGDATTLPRIGTRYIMVTDSKTKLSKKVDLTNEQFSKLQQQMGEEVRKGLMKKQRLLENPNAQIKRKVDVVKEVLADAGGKARNKLRVELGYRKQ